MILDNYDFESVHKYTEELTKHIFKSSDKKIRMLTIVLQEDNEISCMVASMSDKMLFSVLLQSLASVTPDKLKEEIMARFKSADFMKDIEEINS